MMCSQLTGQHAPYKLAFRHERRRLDHGERCGGCARLSRPDVAQPGRRGRLQRLHLLLAMYNAWPPGVFAISGWGLVGALPLSPAAVAHRMGDGDTRWIYCSACDLMGVNPAAAAPPGGLPQARALYAALPEQLARPDFFASQLRRLLAVREQYGLYAAHQGDAPGLLVMVHLLPENLGRQTAALNFGAARVDERVAIAGAMAGKVADMLDGTVIGGVDPVGNLPVRPEPNSGRAYPLRILRDC